MSSGLFLFQGNYLVVPCSMKDEDVLSGVGRDDAERAFGDFSLREECAALWEDGEVSGVLLEADAVLPPDWRRFSVREAVAAAGVSGAVAPSGTAGAAGEAGAVAPPGTAGGLLRCYHVLQWRKESRYCGSCGGKNGDSPEELARLCPRCGRVEYPRIAPAVIVLVSNGRDEILLAHNRKFKDKVYSLIAGFAEAGESLEAALVRELREEVCVEVDNIRYVTSQSWPFPNSLMTAFTARHKSGELKSDGVEILDAGWFSRDTVRRGIPLLPSPGSVSRYLIDRWLTLPGEKGLY